MDAETLIGDYLSHLEAEARLRTPEQADEIVTGVREHIEAALAEAGRRDEATVRTIIDGLGRPDAIVAAGIADGDQRRPTGERGSSSMAEDSSLGANEIVALLLIIVGGVLLPIIGPVVGMAFAWVSRRWSRRLKVALTLLAVTIIAITLVVLIPFWSQAVRTPTNLPTLNVQTLPPSPH